MFKDDQERDEATLRSTVVRALGRSDLNIDIITTGRWELSALIADRFSSGRVFLVGDAAHTLPPARGGYGANTGIEDAFNLAWKLASVVAGVATPDLLETYDAERRPIAWLRHHQIFARQDYASVATDAEKSVAVIEDEAIELGQLYRSKAVLDAGDQLPPARRPEQWAGQPGTRAPHLWVSSGHERLSTLDLFHRGWVLVTEEPQWCAAATEAAGKLGLELCCLFFGDSARYATLKSLSLRQLQPVECAPGATNPEAFRNDFRAAFGIGPSGASLVRPDGYVAWRSPNLPPYPAAALTDALQHSAFATRTR